MVSPRHPKAAGKAFLALVISMLFFLTHGTTNPIDSRGKTFIAANGKPNEKNTNKSDNNILSDVTQAIGETPLVDLSRVAKHYGIEPSEGKILAKLEYLNPGGSKKDRIALSILRQAREHGSLKQGQTVVELTSGNTGTGLAIVCGILGHPFVAVMSKGNSRERSTMMEALGATVVLVDLADETNNSTVGGGVSGADLDVVELRTQEIAKSLNAFRVDQFVKETNALAHYEGTAPELWRDSGGTITDFLDFVGTGGSFGGIARYLKEQSDGAINCYVVEPEAAVVLGAKSAVPSEGCHRIQGGGYMKSGEELPLIAPSLSSKETLDKTNPWIDGYFTVTDEEAISATRNLAKHEGIFAGYSAGANLVAAIKLLRQQQKNPTHKKPTVVAILICDSGLKYMSTDLWK